jgi:hypothetical protein
VIALAVAGLLSACGGSQDSAVSDAAHDFVAAVADGDGEQACARLAPSTRSELQQSTGEPCAKAVLEEAVEEVGAEVDLDAYGTMARVRFDRDTVFLTRFDHGWRVLAAGCTPPKGQGPYDCQVQGG